MKLKLLSVPILLLALVACDRQAPSPDTTAAATPESSTPAARTSTRTVKLPIAGGLVVPADFAVRSRGGSKTPDAAGMIDRVLRVEFANIDGDAAASTLERAFAKKGFDRVQSNPEEARNTQVVRNAAGERVRYVIVPKGPELKIALASRGARGLVTFYWKEAARTGQ